MRCASPSLSTALLLAIGALPLASAAGEFSAEVGLGREYDSNVSVDELDASSSESDHAWIIDAEVQYDQVLSDRSELKLSYDFAQHFYDEFSFVDRQTHILGADYQYAIGLYDTGVYAYYINARLDGQPFLEQARISPYVSGFVGKKWYARGAYVFSDKTLEENEDRDATAHALEGDLYYFRRGLRSYFNAGYRYRDEDAEAARFKFRSHAVKLRFVQRFDLFGMLSKVELAWRYEDRHYLGVEPTIGEERFDKRHRVQADLEVPITERFQLLLYYSHSDYDSNLPRADYDRDLLGTRFSYSWE